MINLINKIKKFLFNFCVCLGFIIMTYQFTPNYLKAGMLENNQKPLDFDDPSDLVEPDDLISNIDEFINLPKGGTPWDVFGNTGMNEYTFEDDEGYEWTGVRPVFTSEIKSLENKQVLLQGYMFPLDLNEKQKTFLLLPFPVSCPYHVHASSNLIIEVHAKKAINYSYDAINIIGRLELVPKDDLYNIFFRLKEAKVASVKN